MLTGGTRALGGTPTVLSGAGILSSHSSLQGHQMGTEAGSRQGEWNQLCDLGLQGSGAQSAIASHVLTSGAIVNFNRRAWKGAWQTLGCRLYMLLFLLP